VSFRACGCRARGIADAFLGKENRTGRSASVDRNFGDSNESTSSTEALLLFDILVFVVGMPLGGFYQQHAAGKRSGGT
jgi:hypothetical protein